MWPVIAATIGIMVALLSFSLMPRQLEAHAAFNLGAWPHDVDKIADAAHHRTHRMHFSPSPWSGGERLELKPRYQEWRESGGDTEVLQIDYNPICFVLYKRFDRWAIHSYGLTDAVLSRVDVPANRPGHKELLRPLAAQLAVVLEWWGRPPEPGMYRAAAEGGVAPPWVHKNLETLELMERKLYNHHDLGENLRLALHMGERIQVRYERKSDRGSRKNRK
jgi:hypothetical protein